MRGKHGSINVGPFQATEISNAEDDIVRYVQKQSFRGEYGSLCTDRSEEKWFNWNASQLKRLSPINVNWILCVGGEVTRGLCE